MMREKNNPIITREDIPDITEELTDVSSVFNPGAVFIDGKIMLLLRVLTRGGKSYLVKAFSDDGVKFKIDNDFILFIFPDEISETVYSVTDPRITLIDDLFYIICSVETESGNKLWITTTKDFEEFEEIGFILDFAATDGVLFPEKINGKFAMLCAPERFPGAGESGIYLLYSEDLIFWSEPRLIAKGNTRFWDEIIFPGTPPVKTSRGWLFFYTGVATQRNKIPVSQVGAITLSLTEPSKVTGRTPMNILEPRKTYEMIGRSPNTITPTGIIIKNYSSNGKVDDAAETLIYYGAADSSVCLLKTNIGEIMKKISFEINE